MAKFKEGSIVKVITTGYKAYTGRIGVVIDYTTKNRLSVDFGKPIGAIVLNEWDLKLLGETANKDVLFEKLHDPLFIQRINTGDDVIEALKPNPIVPSTGYGNCLTDPNVDYEALSEEPVYYEFINIGKALNRLKHYEFGTPLKQPTLQEAVKTLCKALHDFIVPYKHTPGSTTVYSPEILTAVEDMVHKILKI